MSKLIFDNRPFMRTLFALLLLTLISSTDVHAQHEARLREIDAYAQKALTDWRIPGMSIAVVKDDQVIFAKGYGVREMNKPERVDERTLFAIASNSKAFTAAALAILVDEGKVKWDDPVTKYLPEFEMYDSFVTREMTVRDLVSHRSGLATFGGDLLWYDSTYSRAEILRRIRYLKPTTSFRSRYGYQNVMFLAAGMIVERVAGKSWDEFIKERFFAPLGMTDSNTSIRDFKSGGNIAQPHNDSDGRMRVVRYSNIDGVAPAASINSSVTDVAQWLRLQLGRGARDGKRIFSERQSREMWQPATIVPLSEQSEKNNPTRHFYLYGLGWFLNDYHGRKMVSHGGGLDGMISQVAMLPEENLGVVVLTNSETPVASFMVNKIFDVFLGVTPRDWSAENLARAAQGKTAQAEADKKIEAARVVNTKPSLAINNYAGAYTGVMYGDARISTENGKLVLHMIASPNFVGDLEHWHYDTFRVKWRDSVSYPFGRGFVTFTLNAEGKINEMKIDVPNPDFDFKELEFRRVAETTQNR